MEVENRCTRRRARSIPPAPHAARVLGLALCALGGARAHAQGSPVLAGGRLPEWSDAAVGSEEENYLRLLQVAGLAPPRAWSLRPFGPAEGGALLPASARHPWSARTPERPRGARRWAPADFRWVGAAAGVAVNTGFPYSMNDGALWAGRGPTVYARGGFAARWGVFSARVEPQLFWASNLNTDLVPNGQAGAQRFADALEPTLVDDPQRFGDRAYARLDLGQSTVRADALGLTVGLTTANAWLGPALTDPLVLGNNAGGFPRGFVGTSRPLDVGVGTVHARLEAGRLDQSDYATTPSDSSRRLGVLLTVVATVRGLPGLELGGTRFYHEPWTDVGGAFDRAGAPFGVLFTPDGQIAIPQNQLASLFGRWTVAPARLEVWGEFMRNDFSADSRDLLAEPDHNSGWQAGVRRIWARGDRRLTAFRFETLNTRITHLSVFRGQTRPYQHNPIRQGHTQRGQVLGSPSGQGGLATIVGVDQYRPDGRWTVEYARRVRQSSVNEAAPEERWDVYHSLRAERLRFGRNADLFLGAGLVTELNRNFTRDAFNLRLDAGWRFGAVPTR